MNRKLKALSLALAVMALTAVSASAAQANFTSDKPHTILHGTQVGSHVFTAGSGFGGITCATAEFNGTALGTSAEDQTVTPTYANCKDSFGRTVHIDSSGFTYTFTTDGTVHVSGTMVLTVTSGGSTVCTVTIKNGQTNSGIGYHNLGGTAGVTVTTDTEDVISTTAGGFFNCGISNGEHTNGSYEGHTTMTGIGTDGLPAQISVHGPTEP